MKRSPLALLLPFLVSAAAAAQPVGDPQFDSAYYDWESGRYVQALERLERLLAAPGSERVLEPAALLTGELYHTSEIAPDGYGVRWSADGRHAAYSLGTGGGRVMHILRLEDAALRPLAVIPASAVAFAPAARAGRGRRASAGERLAYLSVEKTPALESARAEIDRRVQARDFRGAAQQRARVARMEAQAARAVVRDLRTGRERVLSTPPLAKLALAYSADGSTLYLTGAAPADTAGTNIYALSEAGEARALTTGPGSRNMVAVPAGNRHLVYTVGSTTIAVLDLSTGATRTFTGVQPALSADGSTLAFIGRDGDELTVNVVALGGSTAPAIAARSRRPLGSPALSPDGRRVVYQMMPRDDWELYVAASDGSGEQRVTREIQHDLFPRFISADRVLAVMGESRHRRSYLHDVNTGARTRLFHNNTVRTVAPEYEWAVSPDGERVLIVAERDGDTVSPERGVYVMDLTRRVTRPQVLERVRANLASERALRERGTAMFAPVADRVREVVRDVSVARIYDYERALESFGSKYITQPGNQLAIDYIAATLRSFGYEPELQWFEPRPGVRTANVIATLRGTVNPELIYVASSHFDSVEEGPGADDNSSGTSALLDAARVMAGRPMPATIRFAFFTGEEAGLYGSREFVRRAVASNDRIVGALNNDMIGYTNDHRLDNTIRYSNDGIRDLQHAAAFLFTDLITYDARYYKNTDAHAYYEVYGDIVGGIGSYPILGNPHYHQPHDILETINHRLVAEVSRTTAASLVLLASSPSRVTGLAIASPRGGGVEVKWTASLEQGVRSYVVSYGPAGDPARSSVTVTEPRAVLPTAPAGTVVRVRAVGENGLHGWDWARVVVGRE